MKKEIINCRTGKVEVVDLTTEEIAAKQASDALIPIQEAEQEILRLEALKTPRRITEALLTDEGKAWLEDIEAQMEAQREIIRNAS